MQIIFIVTQARQTKLKREKPMPPFNKIPPVLPIILSTSLFIFSLFIFLIFQIFSMILNNKNKLSPESALLIGIFVNLWPIIPTGNFFNNWLSMAYFIPISYYLFEIKYKTKKKIA